MSKLIHITLLGLLMVGLSGCASMYLDRAEARWNSRIGHSKDELLKEIGPPESCTTLKNGEEVCAWVRQGMSVASPVCNGASGCYGGGGGGSWEHRVIYTFDEDSVVTAWSYKGTLGERRSKTLS